MTNQELVEKLIFHLKDVSKMLSLGNLELLKSDELYNTKYSIEDMLIIYKPFFENAQELEIEKILSKERIIPEIGLFLESR